MPKIIMSACAHNLEELLEVLSDVQHQTATDPSVINFADVCAIRVQVEEETLTDGSIVYNLRVG